MPIVRSLWCRGGGWRISITFLLIELAYAFIYALEVVILGLLLIIARSQESRMVGLDGVWVFIRVIPDPTRLQKNDFLEDFDSFDEVPPWARGTMLHSAGYVARRGGS